jgi:hypothetical protein
MTLKSALQDIKETTLSAVSGLLGKLTYLASLRRKDGTYQHWGIVLLHGEEPTERALKTAHIEALNAVLRTPLPELAEDLQKSSQDSGVGAGAYVEEMRGKIDALLPGDRKSSPGASHLNSVLVALSSLQKHQGRSTRSTS